MSFLVKFKWNSIKWQIFFAFLTLTTLIVILELQGYLWIRSMVAINTLKEDATKMREQHLLLKKSADEFILREKSNEAFFATGTSKYLDEFNRHLDALQKNVDKISNNKAMSIDEKQLASLRVAISQYHIIFQEVVDQIKRRGYGRFGLVGEFDKSIRSLLVHDFGTDKSAIINLELFVKNYLLTGDERFKDNISNEIFNFTMILEKHIRDEEVKQVSDILYRYETTFKQLVKADSVLGIYTGGGLQRSLFDKSDLLDQAIQLKDASEIEKASAAIRTRIYLSYLVIIIAAATAAFIIHQRLHRKLVLPIMEMKSIISSMSRGEVPPAAIHLELDELNEIANALNNLLEGTRNYQLFANQIEKGNLEADFTPLSNHDALGHSLLAMRESLKAHLSAQHTQMLELQRVNSELDMFTYHASHDLRAPLSSIQGLVNLGLKETSPALLQTFFEMISGRVIHMDILLKDLISISYNNKAESRLERFVFESEISSLLRSIQSPERPFEFKLDNRQEITFITDAVRLRAILGNLLSNALKYFNPEKDSHQIQLQLEVTEEAAVIVIRDNGIGIEQEYHEKIFSMFFRATTRSTGTGLGLYIVKSMVERMKGQITFESIVNEGTTFRVMLPNHATQMKPELARATLTEVN